jgi:hypothetical protein
MLRGLKRRLDRLWVEYQAQAALRARAQHRRRWVRDFAGALRAGLARAGIDPATVPAMRLFAEDYFLARAILGPPEPAPRPPPQSPAEKFRGQMLDILRRHREHPIDPNDASPYELFAVYCFDEGL